MSTEENYLDNLLKSITEPQQEKSDDEVVNDGEIKLDTLETPAETEYGFSTLEMPETEPEPEIELSDNELSDIELHEVDAAAVEIPETSVSGGSGFAEGRLSQDEISALLSQVLDDDGEDSKTEDAGNSSGDGGTTDTDIGSEDGGAVEDNGEAVTADIESIGEDSVSDISIDGLDEAIQSTTETELAGELNTDDISIDELDLGADIGVGDIEPEPVLASAIDGGAADADMAGAEEELNIDDVSIDDFKHDESEAPISSGGADGELSLDDITDSDMDLSGADMAVEEDSQDEDDDDFSVDIPDIETLDMPDISAKSDDSKAADGAPKNEDADAVISDVLNMLDMVPETDIGTDAESDPELAKININSIFGGEPVQDDMMDLLHKMADNEAEFVNAGKMDMDDSDEGAPPVQNLDVVKRVENKKAEEAEKAKPKKEKAKKKKTSKKKKKGGEETEGEEEAGIIEEKTEKKPGAMGKFFNMLTEDLVPEPTEEELAAEKAAKEAKKQENQTKKEEEKAAKEEAKKAKAEEKEAAKKAKAAEAEQKKKEKKAAKEAKLAAKRAKEAAKPPIKRIPPKKIMAGAVFGATVFGAIFVATNILSDQGYLQKARRAYYNGDYMTAYRSTYGMELDSSDDIIKGRSETILRMERKYDSYKTNLKMGRELEALNALIESFETYDYINTDAEQYGVLDEVDAIMDEIRGILLDDYGIDETEARELLQIADPLSYSMALNDIINGSGSLD